MSIIAGFDDHLSRANPLNIILKNRAWLIQGTENYY